MSNLSVLLGLTLSASAFGGNASCSFLLGGTAGSRADATLPRHRRIAAVTIGQTPRPDLLRALRSRLPTDVEILEVGALDGLNGDAVAALAGSTPPRYPLTTRLQDGTRVTLEEQVLTPRVQDAVTRAEAAGVDAVLLLCAGGFNGITASVPLIRPFDVAVEAVRETEAKRIAVVVPIEGQAVPSVSKWSALGFEASSFVGAPGSITIAELRDLAASAPDLIVLDYFGHSAEEVGALRDKTGIRVVDLSEVAADTAARLFH